MIIVIFSFFIKFVNFINLFKYDSFLYKFYKFNESCDGKLLYRPIMDCNCQELEMLETIGYSILTNVAHADEMIYSPLIITGKNSTYQNSLQNLYKKGYLILLIKQEIEMMGFIDFKDDAIYYVISNKLSKRLVNKYSIKGEYKNLIILIYK